MSDQKAVNKVVASCETGQRATLTHHQASQNRAGADSIKVNNANLPEGFVNEHPALHRNVYMCPVTRLSAAKASEASALRHLLCWKDRYLALGLVW